MLGGFDARCNGSSIPMPLTPQRVVAFLALRGQPLLRGHVAGTLWIDTPESRAAASLRSALWRLRTPGNHLVEVTDHSVALAPGVDVDLYGATDLARDLVADDAGASPSSDDLEAETPRAWHDLCKDLLPDWYEDWLDTERARFQQLRLHALEALSRRLVRRGRLAEAVEVGQAAVAADPLRESARRSLIAAHLAEGNRADAVRQYREFQRLCRQELGCEPSEQMTTLMAGFRRAAGSGAVTRR